MTEDEISEEMYLACHAAPDIIVLTWQGVGGKSYFYRDLRFLLPGGKKQKPDLVILASGELWIIEIKGSHEESRADDESKLGELRSELTDDEIRAQVSRSARVVLDGGVRLRPAVAYTAGVRGVGCVEGIGHLEWESWRPDVHAVLTNA